MQRQYLYLLLDISAILAPFLFSFYPKANFSKKWKFLWLSTLIPGALFVLWDEWFTRMGVWGFNPIYLTGIYLGNLPLEEVLFFICIPYACVFTYFALNHLIKKDYLGPHQTTISVALIVVLFTVGLLNLDKWYTAVTFISCSVFLLFLIKFLKPSYLGRFYFSYLFILIPFFIINGILTGSLIESPVVWYNNEENLGMRMGTIPIEDTFYGMLMLLMNVVIFEELQRFNNAKQQWA